MGGIRNMRIGKRLIWGFGSLTLAVLVMTVVWVWAQAVLNDMNEVTSQSVTRAHLTSRAQREMVEIGRHIATAIITPEATGKQEHIDQLRVSRERYLDS